MVRCGAIPDIQLCFFDHLVEVKKILPFIREDLPLRAGLEQVMRFGNRDTKVDQKTRSIVSCSYIHGVDAKSLEMPQMPQHSLHIFCGEICNVSDQVFDNGAKRFSLGDRFIIFITRPVPRCNIEFLLQFVLYCRGKSQVPIRADCDFAIHLRFDKLAIRSTFVIKRVHMRMEKIDRDFLLVFDRQIRLVFGIIIEFEL